MSDCMNRRCPNVAEIEQLEAQLKATEDNEQVLVDANKPLLKRIAQLEAAIRDTISNLYTEKAPYYQIHFDVADMLEAALEDKDESL
jgi:septal ring factor EnvC (AmiA/AmiB activator)